MASMADSVRYQASYGVVMLHILENVFGSQSSPVEMFLRGTVVYCAIFALLRLAGRRDIG